LAGSIQSYTQIAQITSAWLLASNLSVALNDEIAELIVDDRQRLTRRARRP
jgi:hypothetical protein